MRRKKSMKFLFLLSILAIVIAGCSNKGGNNNANSPSPSAATESTAPSTEPSADANTPVQGGTLTVSTFSDIVSVNPLYVSDTASGDMQYLMFASLYDLDRAGNLSVEPWSLAAEPPQISEDGKTYTVKMKNTAKWSDGQPITAEDVVFTLNTIINPKAASPAMSSYDKIASVEKLDDYTVKITLKQVYAPFEYSLMLTPVPSHILKDVKPEELQANPYGKEPAKTVTSGAWKWSEWKAGQYVSVEANPEYWSEVKPNIQKIVYKIYADQNTEVQALIKGDVDTTSAIPITQLEAVEKNDKISIVKGEGKANTYEFIGFNFEPNNFPDKFVPFATQKSRQAIAYALNRQGMVDNVLKGTGTLLNAPFLPNNWSHAGDKAVNYAFDPEKAKALLAEDGWVAGKDGILEKDGHRFSFELQYNAGNSRREAVAQIIQQNLKDVGIEVKTSAIDFATWQDQNIVPGKYNAILIGWSLSNPDPDSESIFSSKYFTPTGLNSGWYKNEKLDQLWVDGYSVVDRAARSEIYGKVAEEISTDLPYIFMYQYANPQGLGPRVKFAPEDAPEPTQQSGYFYHIIKWWVTE